MTQGSIWKQIWQGFKKSVTVDPSRYLGEFRGEDYLGNKYYELQADPRSGRSRASRWFESPNERLDQELPPEWIQWLRRTRDQPPTKEEIIRNLAIAKSKNENASNKKSTGDTNSTQSKRAFVGTYPTYGDEYSPFPKHPPEK